MVDQLKGMMPFLKVQMLEPVIAKGLPSDDDYNALDRLADDILNKHKEAGIT